MAIALTGAFASGCDSPSTTAVTPSVIAKVNSREITAEHLNAVLARVSAAATDGAVDVRRKLFERLIDQELAAEQAESTGLAYVPEVTAAVEIVKRETLARAYFKQLISRQPPPTGQEIKRYYDGHPELFAQRRLYTLNEVTLPANSDSLALARNIVASGKQWSDVTSVLQAHGLKFNTDPTVRTPEEMPLNLLPELARTPNGGLVVYESPTAIYLAQLVSSHLDPRGEVDAAPLIAQFLQSQRAGETIENATARMRAAARIEYVDSFPYASKEAAVPSNRPIRFASAEEPKPSGEVKR